MKYIKLFLFFIFLLFNSCIIPSDSMKTYINQSNHEGMIVGTICIENKRFDGYYFKIYNEISTGDFIYSDEIKILGSNSDHKIGKNKYYLFSIVKPKGNYKFSEIVLFLNTGYMQSTRSAELSLPFEIKENEINYLGEIKLNTRKGIFELNNQIERDRKWFKEKFPQINF